MSNPGDHKTSVRRMIEGVNSGELDVFDELMSEEVYYHASSGEQARGPEGFKGIVSTYRDAFDDFTLHVDEIIAEGDKVFVLYRQEGVHKGDLLGLHSAGKKMSLPVAAICTFREGKLIEEYEIFDTLELMQQLGDEPQSEREPVRPNGGHRPWA